MPINPDTLYLTQKKPPESLIPWITHQASLTQKLFDETGDATIKVLNQGVRQRGWWEQQVLGVTDSQVFNREIIMASHQQPSWYARSVIPLSTFNKDKAFFKRLESESMGALIFDTPGVRRVSFVHYALNNLCCEFHWLLDAMHNNKTLLWARLAEFQLSSDHPFFLIEILLPGLQGYES